MSNKELEQTQQENIYLKSQVYDHMRALSVASEESKLYKQALNEIVGVLELDGEEIEIQAIVDGVKQLKQSTQPSISESIDTEKEQLILG